MCCLLLVNLVVVILTEAEFCDFCVTETDASFVLEKTLSGVVVRMNAERLNNGDLFETALQLGVKPGNSLGQCANKGLECVISCVFGYLGMVIDVLDGCWHFICVGYFLGQLEALWSESFVHSVCIYVVALFVLF